MNLGTVVINEHVGRITEVHLANGRLEVTAVWDGPMDTGDGRWIVFAPDGSLVFQGRSKDAPLDGIHIRASQRLEATLHMEFTDHMGHGAAEFLRDRR
jgi:hypothetical protein